MIATILGVATFIAGIVANLAGPLVMILVWFLGGLSCVGVYYLVGIAISPNVICADAVLGIGDDEDTSQPSAEEEMGKSESEAYAKVNCPLCGRMMRVQRQNLFGKVKCPFCQQIIDLSEN